MARFPLFPSHLFFFCCFTFLSLFAITSVTSKNQDEFVRSIDRKLYGVRKEKLSHLRLYWHDIVSGPNPSAVQIVPPPMNNSKTAFGMVRMIDNPLTTGLELSSKLVGRAQGFYGQTSQKDVALLMAMNLAFIDGKYNGSSITVLGRNPVFSKIREMPVIGGSGAFRFARGYAQLRTRKFDLKTGDATVEYNMYVMHY